MTNLVDGVLEIALTKGQVDFLMSDALFPGYFAGYASGKSHIMGCCTVLDMHHSSKALVGVYEPTYDLVKQIAYPRVEQWLIEFGVRYKVNQQDKAIYTSNSGVGDALFRSLENIDALIGYETYRTHVDEFDTLTTANAEKAFNKILGRNRQSPADVPREYRRWCDETQQWECSNVFRVYSTPEGFKFCYKMWHPEQQNARNNPEFKLYRGRTQDNPTLTRAYIENLKKVYPQKLLEAYMNGVFVNLESGTVYYNFCRKKHDTDRVIKPNDVLHIGIDFNVNKTCGVVHVEDGNVTSAVAEVTNQYDTSALINTIKARWPNHRVIAYPDSSGSHRNAANASSSSIALLNLAGFEIRAKRKNPLVKDRVTSFVKLIEDNRYYVNTKNCPEYTRCLEQQAYNDKGDPDKDSGVDHLPDGGGYYVSYKYPVRKPIFKFDNYSFAQKR